MNMKSGCSLASVLVVLVAGPIAGPAATADGKEEFPSSSQNVSTAVEQHTAILGALRAGDLPRAVAALRASMQSAVEPLVEWMQSGASE